MATRLRLPASGSPAVSPSFQSYSHSAATTRRTLPTADSSTLGDVAQTPDAADHLVAGDTFHSQFVSDQLAAGIAFVTSDTVKYAIQCLEANGGNNLFVQLHVRVVDAAGTTEQAVLLTKSLDGTELPTSLNCRTASHSLTGNYTTVAGDRIVVEFSVSGTPTAAGGTQGHNATLRWGSAGAGGDLAENESQTGTTLNPWIEFSRTLDFLTPIEVLPGVGVGTLTGIAAALLLAINVGAGALTATGFAPMVSLTPGAGQLTATGFAPVVDIAFGTRLFDADSAGDKIDYGTGGNRNDRSTTGQMLLAVIHRPDTDTGNGFLITKQTAFTGGYAWLLSGTTPSVQRLIVGRGDGSNFKDVEATEANACVAGQHEIAVTTFDSTEADGASGVRHYRSALDARIAEVSGYTTTSAGSGTLNGDSGANLLVGNWGAANAPYDGSIQWAVKLWKSGSTPYTLAEVRRVHMGLLIMKVGHEEGDTDKIAFGKSMIESVATAVLLATHDAAGATDYSDNAYTGSVSGTVVTSGQPYWGFETVLHNDAQPSDTVHAQEQPDFWYHSGGANVRVTSEATAGVVFAFRYGLSGYDPQANVGLVVNGAFNAELDAPDVNSVNAPTFSGLSAASKTLQLVAPGRGRPPSITGADPSEGTYLLPFRLNRPWTRIAPSAPSRGIVVLSESIFEGYTADPITQLGCMYRLRLAGDGGVDGVTFIGWGGYRIRLEGGDAAGITNIVAQITQDNPKAVIVAIGVNDYTDAVYTLSQYNARIQALIDALIASSWKEKILLIGPIINDNGFENDNGQGYNLDDIRASYGTIASGSGQRVTSHDAKLIVDVGDLTDGTHPDNDGHLDLYEWLTPRLLAEIANVLPGPGAGTLTGFAPTATATSGTNVLAGLGVLTATGFAPTVETPVNALASVGVATLAGFAPAVTAPANVAAGVGAGTLTGFAPTVTATANQNALAGLGQLVATGFAPTVDAGQSVNVLAGVGAATLAGFAPSVVATDPQVALPGVGVLTLTGFAPEIAAGAKVFADVGALLATGFAPAVTATANQNALAGAGQLDATGFSPSVAATNHQTVQPGTGVAVLTGFAPLAFAGQIGIPGSRPYGLALLSTPSSLGVLSAPSGLSFVDS